MLVVSGAFARGPGTPGVAGAMPPGPYAPFALPASAEGTQARWLEGVTAQKYHTNCLFGYGEVLTNAYVGYYGTEDVSYPAVGDVYYIHAVVYTTGSACSNPGVHVEFELPAGTQLAISSQAPVYCFIGDIGGTVGPAANCPQAPTFSYYPDTFAFDLTAPGYWPLGRGRVMEVQVPVVSSRRHAGAATNSYVYGGIKTITAGNSCAPSCACNAQCSYPEWVVPKQGVFVSEGAPPAETPVFANGFD